MPNLMTVDRTTFPMLPDGQIRRALKVISGDSPFWIRLKQFQDWYDCINYSCFLGICFFHNNYAFALFLGFAH